MNLHREGHLRDLALFDLAIDSKLRGCDLVRLRISDLVVNAGPRYRAMIVQLRIPMMSPSDSGPMSPTVPI